MKLNESQKSALSIVHEGMVSDDMSDPTEFTKSLLELSNAGIDVDAALFEEYGYKEEE